MGGLSVADTSALFWSVSFGYIVSWSPLHFLATAQNTEIWTWRTATS